MCRVFQLLSLDINNISWFCFCHGLGLHRCLLDYLFPIFCLMPIPRILTFTWFSIFSLELSVWELYCYLLWSCTISLKFETTLYSTFSGTQRFWTLVHMKLFLAYSNKSCTVLSVLYLYLVCNSLIKITGSQEGPTNAHRN